MKNNMDAGHAETEALLKQIEAKITKEYAQAEREVRIQLDDYLRRFQIKDELKRKALANGLITQAEYDQWRIGQIMVGERWAKMADTLAADYAHAAQNAKQIAFGEMPRVYAINYNYGTYVADVLSGGQIAESFTLYSKDAVAHLFKDGEFYHAPGKKVTKNINAGKQLAWDKKQVQSAMMQSILQGESIPKMATRLATTVGESDRKAAIRNARTMATGVQNAGRVDSFRRSNSLLEEYGLKVRKQWFATLDGRTRHWHAELDGEVVDNDEPFVNDYGEIDYPGDPGADPANVYNCRCTCLPCIEGAGLNNSAHPSVTGRVMGDDLNGISYEEWKAGHYEQHSDPITKQDEIAETMRNIYNAEYRKYRNLPSVTSLGAGSGNEGEPRLLPTHVNDIDFNDKNAIKSIIDGFDEWTVTQDVEHGVAILPNGEVYYAIGDSANVWFTGIEDRLNGAIVMHNHTMDETHFSFGNDDRGMFSQYEMAELHGSDYKYKYVFSRLTNECDVCPDSIPSEEDLEHYFNVQYAMRNGFGYRRIKR